jgi:hypothetical protein
MGNKSSNGYQKTSTFSHVALMGSLEQITEKKIAALRFSWEQSVPWQLSHGRLRYK